MTEAEPQPRTLEDKIRSVIDYLRLFTTIVLVGGSILNGFAGRYSFATWMMATAIFIRTAGVRW
jgi:hypothetical protein